MSYTYPASNEAGASWAGLSAYTRPASNEAGVSWADVAPASDNTLIVSGSSVLGAGSLLLVNDFASALGDITTQYVMDLTTSTGVVRVPIRSWQATLQTAASNYVQCVIPACADWVATIQDASEFAIYRRAVVPGIDPIEYEMARAPLTERRFDRGPTNYTCTISGYSTAFASDEDPSPVFDRALTGIRSVSTGQGTRVRCAVDWLLRPGQRASFEDVSFVVGYINYYVPEFDAYMDVGSAS